ncbi:MAG TPA: hypothetical protein VFS23_29270 [Vicinamibacterales bacterium]|nr:hypothetical protein [Vicinamibacterales bacterium]
MRPARLSRSLHKWLALLVGAQALVWIASGLYMVVVDIDFIHGDTLVRNEAVPVPASASWFPLAGVRARYPDIERVRIKGLPGFGRPLYEVTTTGSTVLLDAADGSILSPLGRARVMDLARHYFAGDSRVSGIQLLTGTAPQEIQSRPLPLWRVEFDDWHETTLYIHPDSGDLVTRRHRSWRWFDALWMLHIMDYDTRTNVNNVALRAATLAGSAFVVSGAWLLWFSFRRRKRQET